MSFITRFLPSLAVLLALSAPVIASDLDQIIPAPVEEAYVPVEIGSGWYIRGDVGFNIGGKHNSDEYDLAPVNFSNSYRDAVNVGAGFGYRVNDIFRLDAGLERVFGSSFTSSLAVAPTGPCNGTGEFVNVATGVTFFADRKSVV